MSNKNKLIGLSLIALATLCACNDDNYADGKGNRLVTFSVNAKANGGWSDINGSRSAWMSPQAQQMGEPVEMEGKLNGNSVYLTSEVTEGFPTDNPTFTRGTQITNADGMSSFGVTAFMGSQKYMDHEKITKFADSWKPQTDYFWLNGKPLDFYAWYPYNSAEGTNGIPAGITLNQEDFSSISYTVPADVSKQEDLMFAAKKNATEPADDNATSLDFKHSLAAVKFVVGDLPTGTKVTSVALKGVKYRGNLAVTAGNNGAAQLAWSNLANETREFTVVTNKEVKENDTDHAITNENQTFFMMPQTLPDDAMVEVVVENQKGESATLTGALQDATAAVGAKNKWEAGKTYTYTINLSGVKAVITFFKGKNYTAHNISANGDPFTVDFNYPQTVSSIKLRFAYVNKDGTFEEIKADGNPNKSYNSSYYDLTGKKTSVTLRSPVMNNLGIVAFAKGKETDFVIQMQVKSSLKIDMPADPDTPDEKREYLPETDDGKWYTLWKGKMFPPNYIQIRDDVHEDYRKVLVARNDYRPGTRVNFRDAMQGRRQYWEVDESHPIYGKGKIWKISRAAYTAFKYEVYWFWYMQHYDTYPGGNGIFGTKVCSYNNSDPWYWTIADQTGGNVNKFIMRGHPDFLSNFNDRTEYFNNTWANQRGVNGTCFVRYELIYKGIYLDEFMEQAIIPQFDY
jgi:hypothetical protein